MLRNLITVKIWYKVEREFEYEVWKFFDGIHFYSASYQFNHKKRRPIRIFKAFAKTTLRGRADLEKEFEI